MFRDIFTFLGRLYQGLVSLVLSAVLAVVAWGLWHFYNEARLENRFRKEGQPVTVTIEETDWGRRNWQDAVSNSVYVTFHHNNKSYTTRCVVDTVWFSEGDRIPLLYHPQLDQFHQISAERKPLSAPKSRLVEWSSLSRLDVEHQMLFLLLLVVTLFFFFTGGLVVRLTNWTFIQVIAQLALIFLLGVAALFFTYEAVAYRQYYQQLKTNGRPAEATVIATQKDRIDRSRRSSSLFKSYRYQATVRFREKERIVAITENDYENLKPGDRLPVLYDALQDDLMPSDYPADFDLVKVAVGLWLIFIGVGWALLFRKTKGPVST